MSHGQSAPSVFRSEAVRVLFQTPDTGGGSRKRARETEAEPEAEPEERRRCRVDNPSPRSPLWDDNLVQDDGWLDGSEEIEIESRRSSPIDSSESGHGATVGSLRQFGDGDGPLGLSNEFESPTGPGPLSRPAQSPEPVPSASDPDQMELRPEDEFSQTTEIYGFLEKYGVAVCKECMLGVPPRKIRGHLNMHSSDRHYKDRIASAVNSWDLKRPQDAIPRHPVPWIRALGLPKKGFRCTYDDACGYVCSKLSTMKKHWSHKHGFSISTQGPQTRQQRRANREREKPMRQVPIQRFFNCECKSWFEVEYEEGIPSLSEERRQFAKMIEEGHELHQRMHEEYMANLTQEDIDEDFRETMALCTFEEDTDEETRLFMAPEDANQFMKEMTLHPLLREFKSTALASLFERPEARGLNVNRDTLAMRKRVWYGMDSLSKIAEKYLEGGGIDQKMRYEVMRVASSEKPSKPLIPYWSDFKRWSEVKAWQQVLMFFFRTHPGHSKRWPLYDLTRNQAIARNRIVEILRDPEPDPGPDSAPDETEDAEDPEIGLIRPIPGDNSRPLMTAGTVKVPRLERALLEFCFSLMDDKFSRREFECALRVAVSVTSTSAAGPPECINKLSALLKIGRTMLVMKANLMAQENPDGPGAMEHLREMVDRFMLWSRHSPMVCLDRLMERGMDQLQKETTFREICWEDDETMVLKTTTKTEALRTTAGKDPV
uniref:ARAD1A13750p n=1 Tax=Blastobotrys adeninivorans TaxID=409370 RepID=A0A060SY49_BLAAD